MKRQSRVPLVLLAVLVGLLGGWVLARVRGEPTARGGGAGSLELSRPSPDGQTDALAEITDRLDALERRLEELARSVAVRREPLAPVDVAREDAEPVDIVPRDPTGKTGSETVRELQGIALDPGRETRDRVLAVQSLWQIELETGVKGTRTPEMVSALLELIETEPSAELRRQICFNVLDALEPWHKPPLLWTLRFDPEASVRAQAADSLQDLQGELDVRAALEEASRSDPDPSVRSTALEMQRRWDERR